MKSEQDVSVTNAFTPPQEGYRSVNLKLDYADLGVVGSYLPTHKSVGVIEAVFASLQTDSRERANTLIAPYGSGKSSLLLFLCMLLEAREESRAQLLEVNDKIRRLAPHAAQTIARHLADPQGYLVVVLTGDEGPLEAAFCTGLQHALEQRGLKKTWEQLLPARKKRTKAANKVEDSLSAVSLYRRAAKELTTLGYKGIIVAYDEFGKVLEAQQTNPRPVDLFFVQTFAELCSRSGPDQIHLFLSLHQGFLQYAHRLPAYMRNEWTKIEGRFRSFHFVEDSLQVYELIAQAIQRLHAEGIATCSPAIEQAVKPYVKAARKIPAFASFESEEDLARILIGGYPLDPLALFVLPRLSARLAQNERTLFHFLLGQETGCLYPLLLDRGQTTPVPFLRAADLFVYFADLMMQDTGVGGTYRRYVEIHTVLERIGENDELAHTVVKTIGILSILNEPAKLPPTEEVLSLALGVFTVQEKKALHSVLERLVQAKMLLHRRHNGEYRIWEGSDVDLTSLLRHKKAEYETSFDPVAFLASTIPAPPILAHRYNEKVGLTRYFEGSFASVEDLRRLTWEQTFEESSAIDGRAYYLFAESQAEIDEALRLTQEAPPYRQILFAIPRLPLNLFEPLLELYCLEQLLADTDFVSQDPVLQRELSELADDCLTVIQRKVVHLFEPRYQETTWVYQGKQKSEITSQAKLRRLVSDICQDVFHRTPRFHNELINRRRPSSTIVNARKRLIRAIFDKTGTENLGLTGYGPEVSIFRALLHNTGLYQKLPTEQYGFVGSQQIKDECLSQTIAAIEEYLHQSTNHPCSFVALVNQLLSPPFGLRAGVLPVLFAAVFQAFPRPLNVMEEGVFAKELKAELFERMLLSPDKVTVQCVTLSNEVTAYLAALPAVFSKDAVSISSVNSDRKLLQTTLEKIYQWSHQLPSCAMTTQRLSESTLALRTALVTATDPVALVLHDIPRVYLGEEEESQLGSLSPVHTEQVLEGLRASVYELDSYKPRVAEEVTSILRKVFPGKAGKQEESLIEAIRQWIGTLTDDISQYLEDPQCAGFLTRVMSNYEDDRTLVESLASLVTGRSIAYWDDSFLRQFELGVLLIYKKITETDELLKGRREQEQKYSEPSAWRVRIEQGGHMAGELMVVADFEAPRKIQEVKAQVAKILEAKTRRLTSEERKRVLVELLREEL